MVGYFWRGVENRLLYRIRCMFAGFETGCSVGLNSCLGLNWKIFAFQLMHGGWQLNGLCRAVRWVGMWALSGNEAPSKKLVFLRFPKFPLRQFYAPSCGYSDILARLLRNPAPTPPDRKRKKPSVLRNISDDGTRISRMPTGFSTPPKPAQDDLLMYYLYSTSSMADETGFACK